MADTEYENPLDELHALMNGSKKLEVEEPEEEEIKEDEEANDEDTDQNDSDDPIDANDESGTTDNSDGDDLDNEEDDDEDDNNEDEENAPVDDDSDTETDTSDKNDGDDDGKQEEVDYKKEYEVMLSKQKKLQEFYDIATSEFTANGQKVKGFTDPHKIVEAQQMAAGFTDKMAGFKPYRKFMGAIKKNGMLDDPAKFELAMDIMNGDKEALKQHIKNIGVDAAIDLDIEDGVKYIGGNNHVEAESLIQLDEVIADAHNVGVGKQVEDILLGGKWDTASVAELMSKGNERDSAALVEHVRTGVYDEVQQKIADIKRSDRYGTFAGMRSIEQYRAAAQQLSQERMHTQASNKTPDGKIADNGADIAAEKARIENARAEADYKAKAKQEEERVTEMRKKATRNSKPKRKKAPAKKFDPIDASHDLEGEDLMDYFKKNILQRKY